jgi:hypothetical protein
MFSAPVEWANFIQQCKAEVPIDESMVEFATDTVSLVAPMVEVQAGETQMLPERGHMASTDGSHGHIKRCRGVYPVDCAL